MNVRIEFHPAAQNELIHSYEWYERESMGLGDRFLGRMEDRLNFVMANPERYPVKKGKFREVKISGFPYLIVYKFYPRKKLILVIHIFHGKRNPKKKYRVG